MSTNTNNKQKQYRNFRPKFSLYHANAKGTGCALKMEMHPALGDADGYFMVGLAGQLTVGDRRGSAPVYPTFDWNNAMYVKLDFSDITKMLEVFRGMTESIDDGKGLYHSSPSGTTKIILRHIQEGGYSFDIFRSKAGVEGTVGAHFVLSPNEAYGLALAMEDSLGAICFGVPSIWSDGRAYEQKPQEQKDVSAA